MAMQWSDDIVIADVSDEPALLDDLASLIERVRDAKHCPSVVINLSAVTFVSSSNLGQLLELRSTLRERDRRLLLCSASEDISSSFTVTGLTRYFDFAPDPLTALATLQLELPAGSQ